MISNSIYPSERVLPYVYVCTHKQTGHFYIGSRCANKTPSTDDLPVYRTSSKLVRPRFEEFDWVIVAEFFDPDQAYAVEQEMIHDNWGDPLILNRNCRHRPGLPVIRNGGVASAETRAKISASQKGKPKPRTPAHDAAWRASHAKRRGKPGKTKGMKQSLEARQKYSAAMKGTIRVLDREGNAIRVSVDDPRLISGDLVPWSKGTVVCFDSNLNKIRVRNTDPRIETGELRTANSMPVVCDIESHKEYPMCVWSRIVKRKQSYSKDQQ